MTSIKNKIASGVFYIAIARYSGIVISLIITAILARLLTPKDFGIVAIAMIIIQFFSLFSELGFSVSIIQNKNLTNKDHNNLFSYTVWMSLILASTFFFSAPIIADYYKSGTILLICRILAVNLFFTTLTSVPYALLIKEQRFKYTAFSNFILQMTGGVFACIAAYYGWGIYALLINPIYTSIFTFILYYKEYTLRFKFCPGLDSLRKVFSYSFFQFLFGFINYFSRNLDKLMIGRYISLSQLGYYEKSYRLMLLPLQNITNVITPVLHPVLSDFQNDLERLSSYNKRLMRMMAFIGFPLSVFLYFNASSLILLFFGNQWSNAVPVFQILSLSVGIQIITSPCGSFFQAANSTKGLFISGSINAAMNIIGMLIALIYWGTIESVAWSWVITVTGNYFNAYFYMSKFLLKEKTFPIFKQIITPILLSIFIGIVLYALNHITDEIPNIISLLISFLIVLSITAIYLQISHEFNIIKFLKSHLKK